MGLGSSTSWRLAGEMAKPRRVIREPSPPQPLAMDFESTFGSTTQRFDPDSHRAGEREAGRIGSWSAPVLAWLIEQGYVDSWPPALTRHGRLYLAQHSRLPSLPASATTEVA
jgi:hypothetical protein